MTGILYLSSPKGGDTWFYSDEQVGRLLKNPVNGRMEGQPAFREEGVTCQPGRLCLFAQSRMHEGTPCEEGVKYIIRSDLYFERQPRVCDSPRSREAYAMYLEAMDLADKSQIPESVQL